MQPDLDKVKQKYTQGVGGACFRGILDAQLKMAALQEGRTYDLNTTKSLSTPKSYRHCLINNEYHVIGLAGEFRCEEMAMEGDISEDSDEDRPAESKTDTTNHVDMPKNNVELKKRMQQVKWYSRKKVMKSLVRKEYFALFL